MIYTILFLHAFYIAYATYSTRYNWENNVNSTRFHDLSHLCAGDSHQDIFIPIGVGVADAVIIYLAQPSDKVYPKCKIFLHTAREDKNNLQLIVIEYLTNSQTFKEIIEDCLGNNKIGYLTLKEVDPPGKVMYICKMFEAAPNKLPYFVYTAFAKTILLQINADYYFTSMKMTVTAARALSRQENCNDSYEIQCTIKRETVCINKALSCDKNINCGVYDGNDEDYKMCKVSRFAYLWVVVLAALITSILVFIIFLYILKSYIAVIIDNFFIFNEDEDNKLVIKSQLFSHIWVKTRRQVMKDPPCFCQLTSDTNVSMSE